MINYLKGELVSKITNSPSGCNITVEVNGIGYLVVANRRVIQSLPDIGEKVKIFTSLVHKEDAMYLCGFDNHEDRDLFNILQSVSGVGVKVAMLLIEELGCYELVNAVISEDAKALSRTKGVGPKVAKRLILELKDKMTSWRDKVDLDIEPIKTEIKEVNEKIYIEVESVLLSLGYSKEEATKNLKLAVSEAQNKNDSEELLRLALKRLATV